ncbi:uncharacterized protein VTP21DRAFT_4499 [Calcarisporiella thermophila]|uniref:uncharacterized protein n=1 Tax=Calcarisporiella thermophila TaxID=911321 RepID=UPI003744A107
MIAGFGLPLLYTPRKRAFPPDDPFFDAGNIESRAQWLSKHHLTPPGSSQSPPMPDSDLMQLVDELTDTSILCTLSPRCDSSPTRCGSLPAYEMHYNMYHRHVCLECSKSFPTARWLSLHLVENHDTFAKVRQERGEKIFECFVESCTKFFSTPKMRRLHLIDKHHYPKNFFYGMVIHGLEPEQWARSGRGRCPKKGQKTRRKEEGVAMEVTPATDVQDEHKATVSGKATGKKTGRRKGKEAGKHKNGTEHDMAIDMALSTNSNLSKTEGEAEKPDIEMEVDALADSMSRLRVPTSISFGRGGGGRQRMFFSRPPER